MELGSTSFTINSCNTQQYNIITSCTSNTSNGSCSNTGNAIVLPAAHYVFGAAHYMTLNNPELYYPNACLFCGLPNGGKKEAVISIASTSVTTTSQDIMVATAAPTMHFYYHRGTRSSEKPHKNHLLEEEIIMHKHHPASRSLLVSIMSKLLVSSQPYTTLQKWRRYLIQKRLVHFPAVASQGQKRLLIPSLFY